MIHIVLLEPEIPQNTGNIARSCVAIGARLHLIEPLGFSIEERAVRRAGLDYWKHLNLRVYKSWADFEGQAKAPCFFVSTKGKLCYSDLTYPGESYFVFGKETQGLPASLLTAHPESCIRIPMRPEARSLNLSNAVAIVAFEALRQRGFKDLILDTIQPPDQS